MMDDIEFGCERFEDRLNDLIDQRTPFWDDEQLNSHAATCTDCQRLMQDYHHLLTLGAQPASRDSEPSRELAELQTHWLQRQWRRKWLLSLAPSFAALVIVAISMMIGTGPNHGTASRSAQNWGRMLGVVADRGLPSKSEKYAATGSVGDKLDREEFDADFVQPFEFMTASSLLRGDSVVDDVRHYSNALYQLANDHSPITTYRRVQHEIMDQVGLPHEPIHQGLPYHGEFSTLPQLRFFFGFAVHVIQYVFPEPSSVPDVGTLPKPQTGEVWLA